MFGAELPPSWSVSRFINRRGDKMFKKIAMLMLAIGVSVGAHGQAWPTKPIRLIVPYGPGGGAEEPV